VGKYGAEEDCYGRGGEGGGFQRFSVRRFLTKIIEGNGKE
jgi:hypothetical protein